VAPRIVASVVEGARAVSVEAPATHRVLAPEVARDLARMMAETCDGGSAAKAFRERGGKLLKEHGVAGKTGTLDRDNPYLQYSWFVGFAPTKEPAVSISVLLGNSELWHLKAHTAARLVLEQALRD
jgi:cell division protein FtsI/penicillin-binding protein 2